MRGFKICVCMKQVPDTQKVRIDPDRGTLVRKGIPSITNPFDESALEFALEIKEAVGGVITAISMGIPDAEKMLKDAYSLGVDHAYLLTSGQFAGADTLATSYTLSRAIKKFGPFDLLLFGKQAIDGDTAQVGPEVAEQLGFPVITYVSDFIEVGMDHIIVERMLDDGIQVLKCGFPVLLTVIKAKQRLRVPLLTSLVESLDMKVNRLGVEDIGADPVHCGLKGSPTRVKKVFTPKIHSKVNFLEGSVRQKAAYFVKVMRDLDII